MTVIDAPESRLVNVILFPGKVTICLTGLPESSNHVLMTSTPSMWPRTGKVHWFSMTVSP